MKKIYLVDTNIISEMTKPYPNNKVINKLINCQNQIALSAITWAEALYGVKRMPESKRKAVITDFYLNTVQSTYSFIPFDLHSASIYSDIKSRLEIIGKPAQELDLQIAACAISNNLILVTRNTKDFENIQSVSNLMIENWFE